MQKTILIPIVVSLLAFTACDRNTDTSSRGNADTSSRSSQGSESGIATRPDSSDTNTAVRHDADNSARNAQDGSAVTAQDQGGSDTDRELTRQIRRALTSNDQLSANGKNIKIITQNGKVTLRGPVESSQEQQTIADLVKGTAGVNTVDNQLEVKSK